MWYFDLLSLSGRTGATNVSRRREYWCGPSNGYLEIWDYLRIPNRVDRHIETNVGPGQLAVIHQTNIMNRADSSIPKQWKLFEWQKVLLITNQDQIPPIEM